MPERPPADYDKEIRLHNITIFLAGFALAVLLMNLLIAIAHAEPTADQFCYPPDKHGVSLCYWPNHTDCAVTTPPLKVYQVCASEGAISGPDGGGTDFLETILLTDVQEK